MFEILYLVIDGLTRLGHGMINTNTTDHHMSKHSTTIPSIRLTNLITLSPIHTIIIKSKQSQNRRRDSNTIMLQIRRLSRLISMFQILYTTTIDPHLNLPLYHVLVKSEMGLRREEPVGNVQALDVGVVAFTPDVDVCVVGEETVCRGGRGSRDDLVLVHLVQMDLLIASSE